MSTSNATERILIIEDDLDVADIFAQLVEIMGFESSVAHDVQEGLERARVWQPQIVLCDLGLPGDGLEFARACRRDDQLRDMRLFAISGRSSTQDREAAKAAGFDDLLGKPIEFATLQAVLGA